MRKKQDVHNEKETGWCCSSLVRATHKSLAVQRAKLLPKQLQMGFA